MNRTGQKAILAASLLALGACTSHAASTKPNPNASVMKAPSQEALQPLKTSVTIKVNGPEIIVHTRYQNTTDKPILIAEGTWGILRERSGIFNGAEDEFVVHEKKTRHQLEFQGIIALYNPPWQRSDFTSMTPGEVAVSSRRIGPITLGEQPELTDMYIYKFLPGTHEYEISTQYVLLNEADGHYKGFYTPPATFTFTLPESPGKGK
jgi:hypothetical protein